MCSLNNIPRLITKKRNGERLTKDEIESLILDLNAGHIQAPQIGALLMAIRLKDMDDEETIHLTKAMAISGETLTDLWPQSWRHLVIDKHSTGGVGDKVSLVLAPALAACGFKVPMISGRGLGHTGGTLDKLEAIPGFNVSQSKEDILRILETVGCCIVGQTEAIVPADRILYPIRDVTATVDSIPLLTTLGLAALVLDIKVGKAAASQDKEFMRKLAHTLVSGNSHCIRDHRAVSVSNGQNIKTTGLLTRMDSPVGHAVGNSLEVVEAIRSLQGQIPQSLKELVTNLGGHLIKNAGTVKTVDEGALLIEKVISDGSALDKFRSMLKAQGVDEDLADKLCLPENDPARYLPKSSHVTNIQALKSGYLVEIDALECAHVCNSLGAGRSKAGDILDYGVGLEILLNVGNQIKEGDDVMVLHHNGTGDINELVKRLQHAIAVDDTKLPPSASSMILEVIN